MTLQRAIFKTHGFKRVQIVVREVREVRDVREVREVRQIRQVRTLQLPGGCGAR